MIIREEDALKARNFAESRINLSKNVYKWRGEDKVEKMIEDIMIGTIGEFGAHTHLTDMGLSVSEPDLKIYTAKEKSHSADLISENYNFHVKSQSSKSIKRYGASWLFQRMDKLVIKPEDKDYICFTSVLGHNLEWEVKLLGIVKARDIIPFYEECKVPAYRHTKIALYFEDFQGKVDLTPKFQY
jgi:hypothetical protein